MKEYELLQLENGIRIVHKQIDHIKIAHVGIMLDIGSRDERPEENGLAHFWEHMAFKGTRKRKAYHIINRLESLGGELNAYTTKEKICFYSAILSTHLDKSIELLSDITFNSVFPERQIDRERSVILEEMAMYRDTPEDAIQDEFDEVIFRDHALGMNILGNENTVKTFQKSDFEKFIARNINTEKIVVSSVGNYPLSKIEKLARKNFGEIETQTNRVGRTPFDNYQPSHKHTEKHVTQVHYVAGMPAYKLDDPKRISFFMLTNILGGPAMNSRLNLSLREKHGYVYGVEAQYSPFTDTGLFSISFATDPKNLKRCESLMLKEINILKSKEMGHMQLHKAKTQLKGQLALSEENNNSMMLMMAKSLLDTEKVPSLNELFDKIDNVSASDLMEVANDAWDTDKLSSLTFVPE